MSRTKQTPRGESSSHRPSGMATARFTGAEEEAEQQADAPGKETEDSQNWPEYGEDNPSGSKPTCKGDPPQQEEGGAEAPPEGNPPPPPQETQPSMSKDPTDAPAPVDPTVAPLATAPTQDPAVAKPAEAEEETPPKLTACVKSYKQAGKTWLDTVLDRKEQAYTTLYDRLSQIGTKHKENLDLAVRDQVFASIKDRSGKCLSKDPFTRYVELEDPPEKQKYRLTGDAKEALRDYYDAINTLSEAQLNFARSTRVLEQKITSKSVFLDIIRQMQLPAVQVSVRTIEEEEQLKNMTYREVTLLTHLPNFKRLYPNANEQTRTLAAFMYYVIHKQITGLPSFTDGPGNRVWMPDNTIQEAGDWKEAAKRTRQDTHHKVRKERRRGSSSGRCHPSQEGESHTERQNRRPH